MTRTHCPSRARTALAGLALLLASASLAGCCNDICCSTRIPPDPCAPCAPAPAPADVPAAAAAAR